MKKLLVVSSLVATAATASYAQELIAGFDFSNVAPGFTSASANFSDLAIDGPASNSFGSFTVVDGIGGFADDIDFDSTSLSVGTTLDSGNRVSGIDDTFGTGGSVFSQNTPFVADATTGGFELTINAGAVFTGFNLSFAAATPTSAGDATLTLTYSVDGGNNFSPLGVAQIDDASASLLNGDGVTFAFNGAAGESASSIIYKGEWTSIDEGVGVFLDNIQVSAVPEPSSFAAIAGALVLGFAAVRRRVK